MSDGRRGWDDLAEWEGATLGEPFREGTVNEVRRVMIGGEVMVARRGARGGEDLDWELDLLSFLAAAGFGAPRIVPAADGRRRVGTMVVMTYVDGRPADTEDDWGAVVEYLGRLHSLTVDWPQRPGWSSLPELVTRQQSGPTDVRVLPAEVRERCRRAWARVASLPRSVIHGDPAPANVRITADGGVALLDWDESRVDVVSLDLARPPIPQRLSGLDITTFDIARDAFRAWEAAMFWFAAPDHARRQLAHLP